MQSRDFCFWLQGFFELSGDDAAPISAGQAAMIRRHLDMVFAHQIAPEALNARERAAPPAPVRPIPTPAPIPTPEPVREPEPAPYPPLPTPMC